MQVTPRKQTSISGVILAGGAARRMGYTNKLLATVANTSIFELLQARARIQVDHLIINTRKQYIDAFKGTDLPIIIDEGNALQGPLMGILTAIKYVQKHHSGSKWLMCFAGDTPLIPTNIVTQLHQAAQKEQTRIAIACSNNRDHYCVSLWCLSLAQKIDRLLFEGNSAIKTLLEHETAARVSVEACGYDPFLNVNTPADLENLSTFLKKRGLIPNKDDVFDF